jgi:hypothetical protein
MPRLRSSTRRRAGLAGVLTAFVLASVAPLRAATMPHGPGASFQTDAQRVNPNAKAVAEFQEEVGEYLELHRKLERTLPSLPTEATPEQIDVHQRALGRLIQQARRNEGVGDVFESDVRPVLRRLLNGLFASPEGRNLRRAIMEENPREVVKLVVNGRYPDTIPLSSMPPQILKVLPQLPPELEYRFIDRTLILLDVRAHIIVDYMTGAVPR